ncbi:MAG: hypothetical protein WDZ60_09575, partial [Wenzhouxiangellaceae bacterium]
RCALAGELLFSVAKKVTKNALYRRQLFDVVVGGVGWLGVSHRAPIRDLSVRFECSSLAHGRRRNRGLDHYWSWVVSVVVIATCPFSEDGSGFG